MLVLKKSIRVLSVLSAMSLGACGGSNDSDNPSPTPPTPPPAATYTVGGSLSGLADGSIGLRLNSASDLSLSVNGAFTFAGVQSSGFAYTVTVTTQPAGQTCTVANGSGTVGSANVTSIAVSCEAVPPPAAAFNRRVRSMRYDFDNNGVFEGTETYSYNSTGKVIGSTWTYIDDGATDADLVSFDLRSSIGAGGNETGTFSYDVDGRLERWTTQAAAARSELNFRWRTNGTLDTATFDDFSGSGALVSRLNFATTYADGRLASWEATLQDTPIFSQELALVHGGGGVLESDTLTTNPGGTQERRDLTWAGGRLSEIRTFNPSAPTASLAITSFEFTGGRPSGRLHVGQSQTYSWNYAYDASGLLEHKRVDLNDDGSIEAAVAIEWEEGLCALVTFWAPRAEADPVLSVDPDRAYTLGDGHAPLPLCGNVP